MRRAKGGTRRAKAEMTVTENSECLHSKLYRRRNWNYHDCMKLEMFCVLSWNRNNRSLPLHVYQIKCGVPSWGVAVFALATGSHVDSALMKHSCGWSSPWTWNLKFVTPILCAIPRGCQNTLDKYRNTGTNDVQYMLWLIQDYMLQM